MNCNYHGYGWYKICRPYGQEQLDPEWIESAEDYESMVEWAENDTHGAFNESLSYVEYLGDDVMPVEI